MDVGKSMSYIHSIHWFKSQVREQLVDSRKDVDWQLKKTCEEFIHLAVSSLVSPIRHFLEKATYLVGEQKTEDKKSSSFASEISTASSTKPLRLQPFATPEKVRGFSKVHSVHFRSWKTISEHNIASGRNIKNGNIMSGHNILTGSKLADCALTQYCALTKYFP